jgi:ribose transport system permease protein/inositol transport system permease protein
MFAKLLSQTTHRLYLAQCLAFFVTLVVVFSLASPYFLSLGNLGNVLTASTVIGLIALGATFVIAAGNIDLSSGAVMALSGTVCAWFMQKTGCPPALAILFAVTSGVLCGLASGFLINVTRAPSFIVTLGMMSVARAAAYIISDGAPIYGLPDNVIAVAQGQIALVPVLILVLLGGIALAALLLAKTRFGAQTLFLGDSAFATEAMGVPVDRLRLKIFGLAGLYSGLAGVAFALRTNSGDPSAGQSYELVAITAVIVGGANLFGGRAAIAGTVLGVLCLGVLQNGLNLLAVNTYYQVLFVGLVLLGAAFLARTGDRR